jgi:hypothetical protein
MSSLKRSIPLSLVGALAAVASVAAGETASTPAIIAALDLSKPFATHSAWSFSASQEGPMDDPIGLPDEKVPGAIHLCLRKAPSVPCDPQLKGAVIESAKDDLFSTPHYLEKAEVVHGPSGQPLLFVQTGSLQGGNGDQLVLTQVLAYQSGPDQFVRVYERRTGRNNNQEVRYIQSGLLRGDIVSVEPTQDALFGFWVAVNAPDASNGFKTVLRYRSATRYGDGNPLAVIDSEMPNIAQRLGLWRPGSPPPLPAGPCPTPHLVHMALWCG